MILRVCAGIANSLAQSYIVRWVKVEAGHTISWSVQPHKKSMYGGTSMANKMAAKHP